MRQHGRRGSAALGDGWHVGIVTVLADDTSAVLDVLGIGGGRRFHTGRMAVPGGVTYLVVTPPAGSGGVTAALGVLCARYDPRVVVLVGGGTATDAEARPAGEREHGAGDLGSGDLGSGHLGAGHPGSGAGDVRLVGGGEPVLGAVAAFFSAAGEPATLPGFGGTAPFRVLREVAGDGDVVARFCAGATTLRGKPLAWAVIRGGAARDAAQALRYLIPYLRPRL